MFNRTAFFLIDFFLRMLHLGAIYGERNCKNWKCRTWKLNSLEVPVRPPAFKFAVFEYAYIKCYKEIFLYLYTVVNDSASIFVPLFNNMEKSRSESDRFLLLPLKRLELPN